MKHTSKEITKSSTAKTVMITILAVILVEAVIALCFYAYRANERNKILAEKQKLVPTAETIDALYNPDGVKLENGRFYLDGNIDNCYFEVTDTTIQLLGTKEQLKKYSDTIHSKQDFNYWYDVGYTYEWSEPKEYKLRLTKKPKAVMFGIVYDDSTPEGYLGAFMTMNYISERAFANDEAVFILPSDI